MAQFGLKADKDTPLRVYVERRPKTQTGRVTWDKILKQAIDNRQKADRDKSVSRRQPVDGSAVFTTNLIVPRALCIKPFHHHHQLRAPRPFKLIQQAIHFSRDDANECKKSLRQPNQLIPAQH